MALSFTFLIDIIKWPCIAHTLAHHPRFFSGQIFDFSEAVRKGELSIKKYHQLFLSVFLTGWPRLFIELQGGAVTFYFSSQWLSLHKFLLKKTAPYLNRKCMHCLTRKVFERSCKISQI